MPSINIRIVSPLGEKSPSELTLDELSGLDLQIIGTNDSSKNDSTQIEKYSTAGHSSLLEDQHQQHFIRDLFYEKIHNFLKNPYALEKAVTISHLACTILQEAIREAELIAAFDKKSKQDTDPQQNDLAQPLSDAPLTTSFLKGTGPALRERRRSFFSTSASSLFKPIRDRLLKELKKEPLNKEIKFKAANQPPPRKP